MATCVSERSCKKKTCKSCFFVQYFPFFLVPSTHSCGACALHFSGIPQSHQSVHQLRKLSRSSACQKVFFFTPSGCSSSVWKHTGGQKHYIIDSDPQEVGIQACDKYMLVCLLVQYQLGAIMTGAKEGWRVQQDSHTGDSGSVTMRTIGNCLMLSELVILAKPWFMAKCYQISFGAETWPNCDCHPNSVFCMLYLKATLMLHIYFLELDCRMRLCCSRWQVMPDVTLWWWTRGCMNMLWFHSGEDHYAVQPILSCFCLFLTWLVLKFECVIAL